jgi:hypothetical protein
MKIGTDPVWMRRLSATFALSALPVVVALMLVAPVAGPFIAREHEFTLVHPIFPHHLLPHRDDPHADQHVDADAGDAAALRISGTSMPVVALAAPSPANASLAAVNEGMLLPAGIRLAGAVLFVSLLMRAQRLADQIALPVPTEPPRSHANI